MYGAVRERAILGHLQDPVLISAFATPTKGGSTAASALSYLAQHWRAEPVAEFGSEHLYSYTRVRPQLQTLEDGQRVLQWPNNTVYLARPEGVQRAFLLIIGVEPSFGWHDFIDAIDAFCRRTNVRTAITLHSTPSGVSHRQNTPVTAVYGSDELRASFGLPATVFHDGPLSFGAVLSFHLNSQGLETADLIALEPFYTPGFPDALAALALVRALDSHFGTETPVDDLYETARQQREVYDRAIADSEELRLLADQMEQSGKQARTYLPRDGVISVEEVMSEVDQILADR